VGVVYVVIVRVIYKKFKKGHIGEKKRQRVREYMKSVGMEARVHNGRIVEYVCECAGCE
jgi:hypothetical protein